MSGQCQVILVSVLDPSHIDKVLMFSADLGVRFLFKDK